MKILITGNTGYIGSVLGEHLKEIWPQSQLIGYDSGFFAHCLTAPTFLPEVRYSNQHWHDIRDISSEDIVGVGIVIHLAGISNDPMGNRFESVTHDINELASIRLAKLAKASGVRTFVFASSCSVYGTTEGDPRKESDPSNPLTAYARSKVGVENALRELADTAFSVTALRFATACGTSSRLRLDLVLNEFALGATLNKRIDVLSDGTPWHPIVDVKDICRAIEWACQREISCGGPFCIVNVGKHNYQVIELAEEVANLIGGVNICVNSNTPGDRRSYTVDFSRFQQLAPDYQPKVEIKHSIYELEDRISQLGSKDLSLLASKYRRLNVLNHLIEARCLDANLRWIRA